jgi:hypothetical protein
LLRRREERTLVLDTLFGVRTSFQDFLRRPDRKQLTVDTFVRAFNRIDEVDDKCSAGGGWRRCFTVVSQDMRFDPIVKAELHLRCEEMRHALWKETEEREVAAQAKLATIRSNGTARGGLLVACV